MKININESELCSIVKSICNKILKEGFNYHFTGGEEFDRNKKYHTDNKFRMQGGRDTGHFGSGTYFSTYSTPFERSKKVMDDYDFRDMKNKELIQIDDNVYRVDFDLYKNLYKVESKKEGDILYTLLKHLNIMYNNIDYKEYDNSLTYQIIKRNSSALGLEVPNYLELTRMMQKHSKNRKDIRSFSTVFMEMNGYNGVNVSGIPYYDNTTHGSVIYDLSKVRLEPMEKKKNNYSWTNQSIYSNTIAYDNFFPSAYEKSLSDEEVYDFSELSPKEFLRIAKNYIQQGTIIDSYHLNKFIKDKGNTNESISAVKSYIKLLYNNRPRTRYSTFDNLFNNANLKNIIIKLKLYYWINYIDKYGRSLLHDFISNWDNEIGWDIEIEEKRKMFIDYINELKKYMNRDFTKDEKDTIEWYRDDLYS